MGHDYGNRRLAAKGEEDVAKGQVQRAVGSVKGAFTNFMRRVKR